MLNRLVSAATDYAETYTGRAFITQTWTFKLDSLPPCIVLPRPKLQSVTHLKYVDSAGVQQTLDAAEYQVSAGNVARIEPAYNASWPTVRSQMDAVEIEFIAGYGDTSASVPERIRHALAMIVGEWDESREGMIHSSMQPVSHSAKNLLNSARVGGLFAGSGTNQW